MHVPSTGELGAKYYYVEHSWSFAAEEAEKVADRTNGQRESFIGVEKYRLFISICSDQQRRKH